MKHLLIGFAFVFFLTGGVVISPSYSQGAPDDGSRTGQVQNKCAEGESRRSDGTCTDTFIPLVGIPYIDTQDPNLSLGGYVDALYKAAISIAAFMAVVKIIFAGVKYMLSDVVTSKEDAKKDIRGALIGLLIVLGAVLILNTINPQLTGLNVLEGAPVDVRLEPGVGECTQTKIDYSTGKEVCVAREGEVCDLGNAGTFCGCGQIFSATMVEPGFRCDTPTTQPQPVNNQCPYPLEGTCSCGEESTGQIVGYSDCIPSTNLPAISTKIPFNGAMIDSTTIYIVNEPAIPDSGIQAGELHNQSGTIVGAENSGSGSIYFGNNNETGSQGGQSHVVFRLDDGTVVYGMGCGLFTPEIPGC